MRFSFVLICFSIKLRDVTHELNPIAFISDETMMIWLLAWCIPMNIWTKNYKRISCCRYLPFIIPSLACYFSALILDALMSFDGTNYPPPLQCFPEVDHGRMGERRIYYSQADFSLGLTYCAWREDCKPGSQHL